MKGAGASAGENGYNPAEYIRGGVSGFADRGKEKNDRTGLADKHATQSCRLPIHDCRGVEDGTHAIPYAWHTAAPFMNDEKTLVAFTFAGTLRNGEKKTEGEWDVLVKGRNLGMLYIEVAEGRRTSIQPCTPSEPDEEHVDAIVLVEVD